MWSNIFLSWQCVTSADDSPHPPWRCGPTRATASSFLRFLDHTRRHITVGRTPLDEWSARRRDLYLYNTQHSQQTNIYAPDGIRTHDLSRRAAADLRLRSRGYWDRHNLVGGYCIFEETPWLFPQDRRAFLKMEARIYSEIPVPNNRNVQCPNPFDSRSNVWPGYERD